MIHAIIPAGGAGTRLWPLSRKDSPKFLADLTGTGRSLLQQTVDRLANVSESTTIVTGIAHVPAVNAQVEAELIAEPSPRDSMAAIGLAAAVIRERHGDVIVGSFAADHLITNTQAFHDAVRTAERVANRGYVVTIGIAPNYPATGFGYIRQGEELGEGTFHVEEFLEKPDAATAAEYVATGRYWWNAGMFVAPASVLLDALKRFHPILAAGIIEIARVWDTPAREDVLKMVWPTLTKIAIDHAIAEPLADAGGVAVVPVEMGWSDVGDFASLRNVLEHTAQVSPGGTEQLVVRIDAPDALTYTYSKPIAIVGIENAIVVETADAILVTTMEHAQSVKEVIVKLDETGRVDLR